MSNIDTDDRIAPKGKIYVCHACGKTSVDQYGYSKEYPETSWGWDVSCVLNSELYDRDQLEYDESGRVCKINPKEEDAKKG